MGRACAWMRATTSPVPAASRTTPLPLAQATVSPPGLKAGGTRWSSLLIEAVLSPACSRAVADAVDPPPPPAPAAALLAATVPALPAGAAGVRGGDGMVDVGWLLLLLLLVVAAAVVVVARVTGPLPPPLPRVEAGGIR